MSTIFKTQYDWIIKAILSTSIRKGDFNILLSETTLIKKSKYAGFLNNMILPLDLTNAFRILGRTIKWFLHRVTTCTSLFLDCSLFSSSVECVFACANATVLITRVF